MSWKEINLSDALAEVRYRAKEFTESDLPYIGLEHIEKDTLKLSGSGDISDVVSDKTFFKSGDILFGTLRPYFRKVCFAKFEGVCSTDITVLRSKNPQKAHPRFFFYFIANKPFIDYATLTSNGTRMPRARWKDLIKKPFLVPDYETQQKIAYILSAYDDLMENNLRRINLLEEAGRLMFKEWFVRLRFPGRENAQVVGGVPDGWKSESVGDILLKFKRKKKIRKEQYLERGKIPIIDQGVTFIGGYTNDIEAVHTEPLPIIVFGDHTRIIKYIDFPFASGADGTRLIYPENKNLMPVFLYFALKHICLSDYAYARHFKYLKEQKILIPEDGILHNFNKYVSKFSDQMSLLKKQNQKLREVRDILLPRLMNGSIQVSSS